MKNIKDHIAFLLVAFPLFLFRVSIIPIRLLGYTFEISMYKDMENNQ